MLNFRYKFHRSPFSVVVMSGMSGMRGIIGTVSWLIKRLGISTSYWNYNSFGGRFLLKATWNYGKVECWNTGYEKRKTPFYSTNVESTFFDGVRFDSVFP